MLAWIRSSFATFSFTPTALWVFVAICLSAILAVWNIDQAQFLGDQGRDALIVSQIFRELDPVFVGPTMSVGDIYIGPFYYYFMLPWLWLSYPSPMGPVYAVMVLHLVTVTMMYVWGKQLTGRYAAMIATIGYAVSPLVLEFAKFSWNPNITPFFSLMLLYGLWQTWKGKRWYWVMVAIGFGILVQLHYLTLLAVPTIGLYFLLQVRQFWISHTVSKLGLPLVVAGLCFVTLLSPLILFDMKHEWRNVRSFITTITSSENFNNPNATQQKGNKVIRSIRELHGRAMHVFFEGSVGTHRTLNTVLICAVAILSIIFIYRQRRNITQTGVPLIITFLAFSLLGLSMYEHSVFDHYVLFLQPQAWLLLGWLLMNVWQSSWVGKGVVIVCMSAYLGWSIYNTPIAKNNWPMSRFAMVAQAISSRVPEGGKYEIVLISTSGDIEGHSYRYFLHTQGNEPVPKTQVAEAETLFIIVEETGLIDNPVDSPIYEVVIFPNKTPIEVFEVAGVEVTVLKKDFLESTEIIWDSI